jgi:ABC-2 type transport system ATP-binding protein
MNMAPGALPADQSAQAHGELVLRTEGLTKQFGQRTAVNGLSLEVYRGDIVGLLGLNGAGKTTTIRMILGLIRPTAGDVILFGHRLSETQWRGAVLRRVGALVEQPTFYPFLSGRHNLRGIATFAGLPWNQATRRRIDEVLAEVGLEQGNPNVYKHFSLGMKQRLGIAAALLHRPDLLILDEPTNGLDPAGVIEIRQLIRRLAQRGITILLSSHLLHEVQQVCSRVAIIHSGHLQVQGAVETLLASQNSILLSFQSPLWLERAETILRNAARTTTPWLSSIQQVRTEAGAWTPPGGMSLRLTMPVEQIPAISALLAQQSLYPTELRVQQANLEQYFMQVVDPALGNHTGGTHGTGNALR